MHINYVKLADDDYIIGGSNHLRKAYLVFRFHYNSQKVSGSVGRDLRMQKQRYQRVFQML